MKLLRTCLGYSLAILVGMAVGHFSFLQWYHRQYEYAFALLLVDSQSWEEATRLLNMRLKRAPNDANVLLLLGRARAAMGDLAGCAAALAAVPDHSSQKQAALFRQGQAHWQLGDAIAAEKAWRKCTRFQTSRELAQSAWSELAKLYQIKGMDAEVEEALWNNYALVDEHEKAAQLQTLMLQQLTRLDAEDRIEELKRLIAGNPDDVDAQVALGVSLLEIGEIEPAANVLRQCVDKHPENQSAWRGWLTYLYHHGEHRILAKELSRVPKTLEKDGNFWRLKAAIAEEEAHFQLAATYYQRAIELSPHEVDLHRLCAAALGRIGKHEDAVAHSERAKELTQLKLKMQTGYEEWIRAIGENRSMIELQSIAQKVARTYQKLQMQREEQAWRHIAHLLSAPTALKSGS